MVPQNPNSSPAWLRSAHTPSLPWGPRRSGFWAKRVEAESAPRRLALPRATAEGAASRRSVRRCRALCPRAEPGLLRGSGAGGGGVGVGAGAGRQLQRPWGRSGGGWSCCGDGREAVAEETHPCPHGQSQRPPLMHSRLGGVGGRL